MTGENVLTRNLQTPITQHRVSPQAIVPQPVPSTQLRSATNRGAECKQKSPLPKQKQALPLTGSNDPVSANDTTLFGTSPYPITFFLA